jgi:hypothetical protein
VDSDGTLPAVGTTAGAVVPPGVGGRAGTGTPTVCTRPKPNRSVHQIEETCTTVPVWGALTINPSPMYIPTWWMKVLVP